MRCLYVEDQIFNVKIMKKIFKNEKAHLDTARNGKEGLDAFLKAAPNFYDLIITDLRMPVMKGQTMIQKIRSYENINKIEKTPILVITGDPSENEKLKCLNILEADGFMNKPIKINVLKKHIKSCLGFYSNEEEKKEEEMTEEEKEEEKVEREKEIIIIEEDHFSSEVLAVSLSSEGFRITQLSNPQEGIQFYKTHCHKIQGILMNNTLLHSICKKQSNPIRDFEKSENLPSVLICSIGRESEEDQKKQCNGVDLFFQKPLKLARIIETIKRYT
jgi:CheY-like chemotaxis protein